MGLIYFWLSATYSPTARSLRNPLALEVGSEASFVRFEPAVSIVVALTVDHPEVSNDALASGINDTSLRVVTSGYWIAIAPAE